MVPIEFAVRFFDLDAVVVDQALLSAEERERVARKATPVLRQRQAASFQCLRMTLGHALGIAPEALVFRIEATGKPVLVRGGIHFNVSHSAGVGLLAWGPRELGADVEALIARPSDNLAEEILAPGELAAWRDLPTALQQAALTRAWTRKEATLKAIGSGLRIAPRTIDVGGFWHEPDAPAAAATLCWTHAHEGRRWQGFEGFEGVPEGYRAAVCIEAGDEAERWFVYVLRCRGDRLYCGIAKDVAARFAEHQAGKGAKFTRAFPPSAIVAVKPVAGKPQALREERAFKALDRARKGERMTAWRRDGHLMDTDASAGDG